MPTTEFIYRFDFNSANHDSTINGIKNELETINSATNIEFSLKTTPKTLKIKISYKDKKEGRKILKQIGEYLKKTQEISVISRTYDLKALHD